VTNYEKDNSCFDKLVVCCKHFGIASVLGKSGGPDNFGYIFIDSNDDPSLKNHYPWIEIKDTGTKITSWDTGGCDDGYKTGIPLGFDFRYYGNNYNKVNIMTNGWINFATPDTWYPSSPFPTSDSYVDPISLFGRDIYPCCSDSGVYYETLIKNGGKIFVVEYFQVPKCCDCNNERYTVQLQLHEGSNNIIFLYKTTHTYTPYIGIEGKNQTDGLTYMLNQNPGDGTVILFNYPGSPRYPQSGVLPIDNILKILKKNKDKE
jgi:hypothetical protein